MDETVIVIMLKDDETGFLDTELLSCTINENEELIYNTYAVKSGSGYEVFIKLTCDRDVSDWEYNAIYDYYDIETISPYVSSIEEEDEAYNPTWRVSFPFDPSKEKMEETIKNLLRLHREELDSVYEAIADKKDEYSENGEK